MGFLISSKKKRNQKRKSLILQIAGSILRRFSAFPEDVFSCLTDNLSFFP